MTSTHTNEDSPPKDDPAEQSEEEQPHSAFGYNTDNSFVDSDRRQDPRQKEPLKWSIKICILIIIVAVGGILILNLSNKETKQPQSTTEEQEVSKNQDKVGKEFAGELLKDLKANKAVSSSIKFECSQTKHQSWSSGQAYMSTAGNYRFEKVPYDNLNLVQKAASASSTDYHFSDVVMFLQHYPVQDSIFIHSSPVYLALLAGAVTDSKVKIVINSRHPEKKAIKTAFVINGLIQKVHIAEEDENSLLMQKAGLVITTSSSFADCEASKDTIFFTASPTQSPVSKGAYILESIPSCSPLKITPAEPQLKKNTFFLKRSEVPPKMCSNIEFKPSTKPTKKPEDIENPKNKKEDPKEPQPVKGFAGELLKDLKTNKAVSSSIKFECSQTKHQSWSSGQAYMSTAGNYRFEKVPYDNLNLVQKAASASSTDYHFSDVVMFLQHYPVQDSIFIHSSPVYLALLAGAVTDSKVKIVINSRHPEKKAIKTAFVINGLIQKVHIAEEDENSLLMQKAGLVITTSSSFADCEASKDTIFFTASPTQSPVSKGAYILESIPSCSPLKITPAEPQLKKNTFFLKRSEVPPKMCSNIEFKPSTKPTKKPEDIENPKNKKEDPKEPQPVKGFAGELLKDLKTNKAVSSSIKFECSQTKHQSWSSGQAYMSTAGNYRFEKVPYDNLNLVQKAASASSTDYHFSDVVMFLQHYPVQDSIFIHSSPVYLALLAGAVTDSKVKIVINSRHPEKKAIKTAFVINGLIQKVHIAEEDENSLLMQKAGLVITTSSSFADCEASKDTIFFTASPTQSPVSKGAYILESIPSCSPLKITPAEPQLKKNTFFLKRSEVPPKMCSNIEFKPSTKPTKKPEDIEKPKVPKDDIQFALSQNPDTSSSTSSLQCPANILSTWSVTGKSYKTTLGAFQIQKVPYSTLNLIEATDNKIPTEHYPQIPVFFQKYKVEKSIYIHSASEYLSLLIGAASKNDVKIILANDYLQRRIVIKSFVVNGLLDKVIKSTAEEAQNHINESSLLVTTSQELLSASNRPTLFYTSSKVQKTHTRKTFKLQTSPICSPLERKQIQGTDLQAGLYLVLPTK